jgi:hypothetical protein
MSSSANVRAMNSVSLGSVVVARSVGCQAGKQPSFAGTEQLGLGDVFIERELLPRLQDDRVANAPIARQAR